MWISPLRICSFALQMTNKHTFVLVGGQNSLMTAGSNITDPMIKINSYMSEKHFRTLHWPIACIVTCKGCKHHDQSTTEDCCY